MKLVLIFFLFLFTGINSTHQSIVKSISHKEINLEETVYICNGTYATKYHKTKTCGGLNNCKGTITSIDKSDAVKKGRTACLRCY